MLDWPVLLALSGAGLFAGFVDAIAGGGGMIALPALLSAGLPPVAAIATTKVQSTVGTAIAAVTYWRGGFIDLRALLPAAGLSLFGSALGALAVSAVDTALLQVAVPAALIAIALYFLFAPRLTDADRAARLPFARFVPVMALVGGFYDGLFGPGTGSFWTIGFVLLFGLGVTRAAGSTKALNLASNIGALSMFILGGQIAWSAAIGMALGNAAGGFLGARLGIRFGARLIRPLVVVVSVLLALRLLFLR